MRIDLDLPYEVKHFLDDFAKENKLSQNKILKIALNDFIIKQKVEAMKKDVERIKKVIIAVF